MKEKFLRLNLFLGLIILLGASVLIIFQYTFIKTWYYSLAWWSFILIMDSVNFRMSRSSLIYDYGKGFFFYAFLSVTVWLLFELFNLRINNWSYHNLPLNTPLRWFGYFVAFATVIPALMELSRFFGNLFKGKRMSLFRLNITPLLLWGSLFLGVVCIFLPLIWPLLFFPLVWLCFVFLLEPVNYWLGNPTFIKDIAQRNWDRFWSWLMAGLAAGFFWEFWNFWSGSHWEYSIPYLNFGRIFQMPVFGYFGFLPFALEIFVIVQMMNYGWEKLRGKVFLQSILFVLLILFDLGVFWTIDRLTLVG
ncbi:hypothetical protein KGY73_06905 [bacterium]|nr:hypothetical protein [bacterium]